MPWLKGIMTVVAGDSRLPVGEPSVVACFGGEPCLAGGLASDGDFCAGGGPSSSLLCTASWSSTSLSLRQLRREHACLRQPGPPNFGLSRQFLQVPQSSRLHASHVPQRTERRRLLLVAVASCTLVGRHDSTRASATWQISGGCAGSLCAAADVI